MIKRDKRNLGKKVKISSPGTPFHGRIGTVVGFRGNHQYQPERIPFVTVNIHNLSGKGIVGGYPFPGNLLEKIKQGD